MKRLKIYTGLLGLALSLSGCNSFLDVLPDQRSDIRNPEKLQALLVSAYPTVSTMAIYEPRTDNMDDSGPAYKDEKKMLHEGFYWEDVSETYWDSPNRLWNQCYEAIATANQALATVRELGYDRADLQHIKGEALLCRAWSEFVMLNTFGKPYSTSLTDQDLGVPYWLEPEDRIGIKTSRKTVKECYELIDKDIQEGLPLIDDAKYKPRTQLYHFNKKAAAAFAAQFYLYYEQWEKARDYATQAIGLDPSASLRDLKRYGETLTDSEEWVNAYSSSDDPSNLLIQNTNVLWQRSYRAINRISHSKAINDRETFGSKGPWDGVFTNISGLVRSYTTYPNVANFIFKFEEKFELTDAAAGSGQPWVIARPFTVERALFVRAEANAMLKDYAAVARDLSYFYVKNGGRACSVEEIAQYYDVSATSTLTSEVKAEREKYISKPLHPKFALESGTQYNMIQAVLHARRIDGVHEGTRWEDIRRYGIEVVHQVYEGEKMVLRVDDPRRVIQIPKAIVQAGLTANPTK